MGGRALPTLAYKLDRHTRSDYLDCHIYLERGAIHHSSVADSTRPMLIPSGRESSLPQPCIRCCLLIHSFHTGPAPNLPHTTQEENAAFAFGEPTEASRQGKGLHWSKAECIWRTCLGPSLPPSETTLSSLSHLGNSSIA